ncbi:MAG: hypothetical protein ACHQJ5_10900 [Vicinamibacteria bacterium]|jgi:hypothetical protein
MAQAAQPDSLLAGIDIQNEIAAGELDFDRVLDLVCSWARELTAADCASIQLIEDGIRVQAASCGVPPGTQASIAAVAIRDAGSIAGTLKVEAAEVGRLTAGHFKALELLAGVIAARRPLPSGA